MEHIILERSEDWEGLVLLERMEHLIGKEKFPVFTEYEKDNILFLYKIC